MSLPTLDLSLFANGSDTNSRQFASDLFRGLRQYGFVRIVNHGFTDLAVAKLFEWVSVERPLNDDQTGLLTGEIVDM